MFTKYKRGRLNDTPLRSVTDFALCVCSCVDLVAGESVGTPLWGIRLCRLAVRQTSPRRHFPQKACTCIVSNLSRLPTQSAPDSAKLVPDGTVSAVAEDEEDISDEEKLNRIFLKFDVDKDGILNKQEASAYSVAKEGEGLDDDTWAQICEVLEVDPETGMSLADFQKMYELTAGEGNVIGLDYLKLCVVS
jgi:hypothetical protein